MLIVEMVAAVFILSLVFAGEVTWETGKASFKPLWLTLCERLARKYLVAAKPVVRDESVESPRAAA